MRRVYDDTKIRDAISRIDVAMERIDCESVCEYSYGINRASVSLIKKYIGKVLGNDYKFGNTTHANGIGNNNAIEIIYTGNAEEEQICGLLNLINDMFGGVYVYVTDIDGHKLKHYGKVTEYGIRRD